MRQILVYGDSLTWGVIPDTRRRLPFEARTVWDDPFKSAAGSSMRRR